MEKVFYIMKRLSFSVVGLFLGLVVTVMGCVKDDVAAGSDGENYEALGVRHKKVSDQKIILIHLEDHGYRDEVMESSPEQYRSTMPSGSRDIYRGSIPDDASKPSYEYIRVLQGYEPRSSLKDVELVHDGTAGTAQVFGKHECTNLPHGLPVHCLHLKLLELVGYDPVIPPRILEQEKRWEEGSSINIHRKNSFRYQAWSKKLGVVIEDHKKQENLADYDAQVFSQKKGQFSQHYHGAVLVFVIHTNKNLEGSSVYKKFLDYFWSKSARVRFFVVHYGSSLEDHSGYKDLVDHVGGGIFSSAYLSTAKDLAAEIHRQLSSKVFVSSSTSESKL